MGTSNNNQKNFHLPSSPSNLLHNFSINFHLPTAIAKTFKVSRENFFNYFAPNLQIIFRTPKKLSLHFYNHKFINPSLLLHLSPSQLWVLLPSTFLSNPSNYSQLSSSEIKHIYGFNLCTRKKKRKATEMRIEERTESDHCVSLHLWA